MDFSGSLLYFIGTILIIAWVGSWLFLGEKGVVHVILALGLFLIFLRFFGGKKLFD